MRWALVTGTSTGIGREIALQLVHKGISVFAGLRTESDGSKLAAEGAQLADGAARLIPILLDVGSEDMVAAAIERVAAEVGEDGLWAVVNNAGFVMTGPVEHLTREQWRKQFEVNVFAVADLTRQALPLLRQSARKLGAHVPRVMVVSSIGGRVPQPVIAPYTSSKAAVTSLGESLRMELRRQGIGVTVVEPGAVATAIWGKGDVAASEFAADHPARRHYGPEIDGTIALARKTAAQALAPQKAARVVVEALLARRAPARVLVGADAQIASFLKAALPVGWFDAILLRQFGVGGMPITAGGA